MSFPVSHSVSRHSNFNNISKTASSSWFLYKLQFFVVSLCTQRVVLDHTSYCASKGALNQVTRSMCFELGPHGIRTNNVNPTVVMTKMGAKAWSDPVKSGPILNRIPLGRFAGKYCFRTQLLRVTVVARVYVIRGGRRFITGGEVFFLGF